MTADWAASVLKQDAVQLALLEGYAMKGSVLIQMCENASVLKQYMDIMNIRFVVYAPNHIKKEFSGKGNAKKNEMVDHFIDTTDCNLNEYIGNDDMYAHPIEDMVDGFAMLKILKDKIDNGEVKC